MTNREMKPYVKLATTLVVLGTGIIGLERLGLSQMTGIHLAGWLISALVIVPVILIVAGCTIFMFGRMRRL